MNPMRWLQPMQFGSNERFVQSSPMSNSTYLNQPTLIPIPNSPQYPSQHSPALPGVLGMDNRHAHVQSMPGTNRLPVNSCTSHINPAVRAQVPLQPSMAVMNSSSPLHSPSMRLPFNSNEMPSQILFRQNSTGSHAGRPTPQTMRYIENPNAGYNGRSTLWNSLCSFQRLFLIDFTIAHKGKKCCWLEVLDRQSLYQAGHPEEEKLIL